ncbi:hypothetical protein Hanom_Chr02g00106071 [Helianthus anomalus]
MTLNKLNGCRNLVGIKEWWLLLENSKLQLPLELLVGIVMSEECGGE